ncbi:MAG TPA: hypothetical protein PKG54_07475 [Phycisphaerae bacterium]|jgi:hypothetical protein|nr:hypothetical protein [Phycisphaerae bacterium]HOB74349.1 hypothetical protein [Phycisphaerae bacterium]HOJ56687.1 hypothetical protein [Phycisphaerae bacterium]HOL26561.1 hypothetical protein [Phycisphaerae bacterium]HPP22929.1 hypothetical protein [Phycisphaerae bacterium]
MRTAFWVILMILIGGAGADGRIDLAEFGRVVEYLGDSPETLEVRSLERGVDGWTAWRGPDGQFMIGLEFDEPRDLQEVGIEFRHAIADRHLVQVQYFRQHNLRQANPRSGPANRAPADDRFHGEWVTAKAEWWAGDRDVNFKFVPYSQELAAAGAQAKSSPAGGRRKGRQEVLPPELDVSYRRTYRIRFLLGDRELPPVRYIRAYGPRPAVEGRFDLQFEADAALRLPLEASVVNGFLLQGEGRVPVMEMTLDKTPVSLLIRYARGDVDTPTRTKVTLRQTGEPRREVSFLPAEVANKGRIRVPSAGVTISHRGAAESQASPTRGIRPTE